VEARSEARFPSRSEAHFPWKRVPAAYSRREQAFRRGPFRRACWTTRGRTTPESGRSCSLAAQQSRPGMLMMCILSKRGRFSDPAEPVGARSGAWLAALHLLHGGPEDSGIPKDRGPFPWKQSPSGPFRRPTAGEPGRRPPPRPASNEGSLQPSHPHRLHSCRLDLIVSASEQCMWNYCDSICEPTSDASSLQTHCGYIPLRTAERHNETGPSTTQQGTEPERSRYSESPRIRAQKHEKAV
jgi:hypothetical protein